MFRILTKIKPELQENFKFINGLKIIRLVQIIILVLVVINQTIFWSAYKPLIDFKNIGWLVQLSFAFFILEIGNKWGYIYLIGVNSLGFLSALARAAKYFQYYQPVQKVLVFTEIFSGLFLIVAVTFLLNRKETRYYMKVSTETLKSLRTKKI